MKKPILAQLISTFNIGGAEVFAFELASALRDGPFHPIAIGLGETGPIAQRFADAGIETCLAHCGTGRGLRVRGILRLARILRKHNVATLHCHNRAANIYGAIAARLAGVPLVVCTRHSAPPPRRKARSYKLEYMVRPLTHHYIAVSQSVMQAAVRIGRVPRNRVTTIYNGINMSKFRPAAPGTDTPNLICVARLSREKAHAVLLDAARRLLADGVKFRLRIVGDGPIRSALEQQRARLGIEETVEMLGARDDVPALLRNADLFVLPSSTEGLPMTIIEAMASALPVVATRVGGVPELVKPGVNGLLVPPQDPDALASALRKLIEDSRLRHDMGAAGRRFAEENFDIRVTAQKHENLFIELLQKKAPHALPHPQ